MDNQPNVVNKKEPAVATKAMSTARKLVLAALVLHFCSLFFIYQDDDVKNMHTILWNTNSLVNVGTSVPEQTGMQLKPFGEIGRAHD